jgi:prophage maintenance system killer protein
MRTENQVQKEMPFGLGEDALFELYSSVGMGQQDIQTLIQHLRKKKMGYQFAGNADSGLRDDVKAESMKLQFLYAWQADVDWVEQFATAFSYESNKVEGSTFSIDDTTKAIREAVNGIVDPAKQEPDFQTAVGHYRAFYRMLVAAKNNEALTLAAIVEAHDILMPYSQGLRNTNVQVGTHIAPDHSKVHDLLSDSLVEYIEAIKVRGPLLAAAQYHIEFEKIHPFKDGNGRTGRLILCRELMRNGFMPISINPKGKFYYYEPLRMPGIVGVQNMENWVLSRQKDTVAKYKQQYQFFHNNEMH